MNVTMDELFGRPANDFYEMELIGDHMMLVAVPVSAPALLPFRRSSRVSSGYLTI